MEGLGPGLAGALRLIAGHHQLTWDATILTLQVCGCAIVISLLIGVPIGVGLGLSRFPGRRLLISLINTGMGLPPVVVGLALALLLWRSGPLGGLDLMYTPAAMVIADVIISLPLVVGITLAAVGQLDREWREQILALGATRGQTAWLLLRETRLGLLAAVMAGLGSILSEVGAVMMVGGNIEGQTRVLTTGILMYTRMGRFELAIALGLILLGLTFTINWCLTVVQQSRRVR